LQAFTEQCWNTSLRPTSLDAGFLSHVVRSNPEEWQPRIKKHVHWQKYVEYFEPISNSFSEQGVRRKTSFRRSSICTAPSRDGEEVAREQAKNPVPPVKLLKAVSVEGREMAVPRG
jgi:hypothetical protein